MRKRYSDRVNRAQFFTDREAWNLFRLAAFGEAFGWTLLISGILFKYFVTPHNNVPVEIVGQVHGTLFLIYITAVVVLHPSLKWTPHRTLIAGLMSVPPYGTLVFEQWLARLRHRTSKHDHRQLTVRALIQHKDSLLAMQPVENGYWFLPGGYIEVGEHAEQALTRLVSEQTGIRPTIGNLVYVWQNQAEKQDQFELFFIIKNAKDYTKINYQTSHKIPSYIDELSFIMPRNNEDMRPEFLQTENIAKNKNKILFI